MFGPRVAILSALAATLAITAAQAEDGPPHIPLFVDVPWVISGLSINNNRHGTGGNWQFNITDNSTEPQGFQTECHYFGEKAHYFAVNDYPINEPCNPDFADLTFTFAPASHGQFRLNIQHWWGDGGYDNGTWHFSHDDVIGQQNDIGNWYGQVGSFWHIPFNMYPDRSTPSEQPWP